ncbi:uncharacterized protein M6B38_392730 [Iris pallida]|uniref:DUF7792 domain-containing protein n=1 Tax=Iris pallida TaxID=29817 RepID=A0AAX6FZ00_IRIPA|nr:uncharacterized protein M6B38_392730 [Iris pallida]
MSSAASAAAIAAPDPKSIDDELSLPILLAERVLKAVREADSFKHECGDVGRQVHLLSSLLRSALRSSASSAYERPVRRIFSSCSATLDRALSLILRCKHRSSFLRRVAAITTTSSADFKRLSSLLDASLADLRWLLSLHSSPDPVLSLPPIASTDPILSWVWSFLAAISNPSSSPSATADAANSLAGLALDNSRNRKILFQEGALPPLLALMSNPSFLDAQLAATTAVYNLAADAELVGLIVQERAVPTIVQVLSDSPMRLQTKLAELVARMASFDVVAQEEFALENVIRPLVSSLSMELPLVDLKPPAAKKATSIHSLVKGMAATTAVSSSNSLTRKEREHVTRRERDNESPEVKLALKTACAHALWMLARNSATNSRKITETKGLLCLSKIVEREKGELQHHCFMALAEIAAVAETNEEIRRSAFKTNSPAAKSAVEQLLRVAEQQGSTPALQIAAVRSIGSLARTFSARETQVMSPLVAQLGHWNQDVAAEAAIALGKFVNNENYLHLEHSKAMIEFGAVAPLIRLVRSGEKSQLPALVVLCCLALNVPNSEALERTLGVLESAAHSGLSQNHSVKELLLEAICHLQLYRVGAHTHKDSYTL